MVREIITDWSVEDGGGGLSVMYFDEADLVSAQRLQLGILWGAVDAQCSSSTSWTVRTEGRELNTATGVLTGVWSHAASTSGTGGGSSFSVANTSQLLIRWLTSDIVDGRFVRGRTNVPGIDQQHIDGDWTAGVVNAVAVAAGAFIATGVGFGVWHRPVAGAGGSFHLATGHGVWTEAAVQRRRRS